MEKKKRKRGDNYIPVYIPAHVEVPTTNGDLVLFRITIDGDIYQVHETFTKPKYRWELAVCEKTQKKPYRVRRESLTKVVNPQLQRIVFHKYLNDLAGRIEEKHLEELKEHTNAQAGND